MKITTVVGARPQFIKASFLSKQFYSLGVKERLIHTGQHYDQNMSDVFFEELEIPKPSANLEVSGKGHGTQTGQMLARLEEDLNGNRPDAVLVYGDTNSTLAGALAAAKMHIPVIHVEAGLRSFDKNMPEEINRILTDHVSKTLLCPTESAVQNLKYEGITSGVHLVGDVMHPVLHSLAPIAREKSTALNDHGVHAGDYYLATIHRAENTDNEEVLASLLRTLCELDRKVLLPLHPRTMHKLQSMGWENSAGSLKIIEPIGYLDMLALISSAKIVLTDSGGLQKEAAWLSTPCVTLRSTTEWVETVDAGWNALVGTRSADIHAAVKKFESEAMPPSLEVKTLTAEKIVQLF